VRLCCFFFQAEDGIRYWSVTGVQTCALPILTHWDLWSTNILAAPDGDGSWRIAALLDPNCKFGHAEAELAYLELFHTVTPAFMRSEERRVGKEGGARGARY